MAWGGRGFKTSIGEYPERTRGGGANAKLGRGNGKGGAEQIAGMGDPGSCGQELRNIGQGLRLGVVASHHVLCGPVRI